MKTFKAKKVTPNGIWVSEIVLKKLPSARRGKVNKLLKLLEPEGFEEKEG